jgi:hypothetical protein
VCVCVKHASEFTLIFFLLLKIVCAYAMKALKGAFPGFCFLLWNLLLSMTDDDWSLRAVMVQCNVNLNFEALIKWESRNIS